MIKMIKKKFKLKNSIKKLDYILFLIIILTLFLRLFEISNILDILEDEAKYGVYAIEIIKTLNFPLWFAGPMGSSTLAYSILPFLLIFGRIVFSLRIVPMLIGTISVIINFYFVKDFFDRKTAIISSILFSTSLFAIVYSRILFELSYLPIFVISFLYFFNKFISTKNSSYLFLASMVGGLGVITKIAFLYFIFSALILFLLFKFKNIYKTNYKIFIIALIIFLLYISPFIFHEITYDFEDINFLKKYSIISYSDINNLQFTNNFYTRFYQFNKVIGGDANVGYEWGRGRWTSLDLNQTLYNFWFIPLIFWASVLFYLFRRNTKVILLVSIILLNLFFLSFTITDLGSRHLFIIFPLPFIVISKFLTDNLKNKTIIILILIFLILNNLYLYYFYFLKPLNEFGMPSVKLGLFFQNMTSFKIITVRGGIADIIKFFNEKNNIIPLQIEMNEGVGGYSNQFKDFMKSSDTTYYVFDNYTQWGSEGLKEFEEIASNLNSKNISKFIIYSNNNIIQYIIYKVN
jgi:4-amino-4-deoxy-L-arabinose transferase-like glycosyltransferase